MSLVLPEPNETFDLTMSDGALVHVRRHGNPNGLRLFVTHGNGFAVDGYLPFWGPLREDFDLVIFDMRNHGRSPHVGSDGHNYGQLARDIGSIYHGATAHLGKAASVGVFHSFTARSAMKHAVQHEWVWDAMVLFDPPNVPPPGHRVYEAMGKFERRLVEWAMNRPNRFDDPAGLAADYKANRGHARWVAGAHELMAQAVLRPVQDGTGWELCCQRELEASIYLEAMAVNLWPPFDAFSGPVKLIGADPEFKGAPPTGLANQALHQDFGYDYQSIPEAGHMLQIEKPVECIAALKAFLTETGLSG